MTDKEIENTIITAMFIMIITSVLIRYYIIEEVYKFGNFYSIKY